MDMDYGHNIHSVRRACEVVNASPVATARRSTTRERDEPETWDGGRTPARSEAATAERQSAVSSPLLRSTLGTAAARRFTSGFGEGGESQGDRGNDETRPRHTREREQEQADTTAKQKQQRPRERQAVRRQQVHARGHQCCKCDLKSPSVPCELVQNTCGEGGLPRRFGRGHFIP